MTLWLFGLAPAVLAQEGRTPHDGWLFKYDARLGLGVGYPLSPLSDYNIALEFSATFRVGLEPWFEDEWTMTLMPEIGYTGFVEGELLSNYFVTGVGVGWTWEWFVVGVVPGFLAGSHFGRDDQWHDSFGFRVSLVAEIIGFLGIQASCQIVGYEGRMVPEFQATASLNLLPVIIIFYLGG